MGKSIGSRRCMALRMFQTNMNGLKCDWPATAYQVGSYSIVGLTSGAIGFRSDSLWRIIAGMLDTRSR